MKRKASRKLAMKRRVRPRLKSKGMSAIEAIRRDAENLRRSILRGNYDLRYTAGNVPQTKSVPPSEHSSPYYTPRANTPRADNAPRTGLLMTLARNTVGPLLVPAKMFGTEWANIHKAIADTDKYTWL